MPDISGNEIQLLACEVRGCLQLNSSPSSQTADSVTRSRSSTVRRLKPIPRCLHPFLQFSDLSQFVVPQPMTSNYDDQDLPQQRPDSRRAPRRVRDFFSVPAPVKRVFDRFPLLTYPANDLPHHAGSGRSGNQLFVFIDAAGARRGRPSFNPQCLKWQVWIEISYVGFCS